MTKNIKSGHAKTSLKRTDFQSTMNRLSVYSYLTRYATGNTGSDQMFTECVPEKKSFFVLGQLDIGTNPGPPFQDLTSGWKQPESDNYLHTKDKQAYIGKRRTLIQVLHLCKYNNFFGRVCSNRKLSATGRNSLRIHRFCPPPVISRNNKCAFKESVDLDVAL